MNKGGILYLSAIKGNYEDSGFVKSSTGDECYIYYYDEIFLEQLLQENQFELVELKYNHDEKPSSVATTDIMIIARKL